MIKRVLAIVLALMMLAGCQSAKSASSQTVVEYDLGSSEKYSPTVVDEVIKDGAFQFQPLKGATFTMDYEPRQGSYIVNHFGLDFIFPYDTNWLGDEGLKAKFDLNKNGTDVYGSVEITTAPKNVIEYYGTDDNKVLEEKVKADLVTAEAHYNSTREKVAASGAEIVKEGYGFAFPGIEIWRAFYIEHIDAAKENRSMHLYLCNDEVNEKFYSFEVKAEIPNSDTETIDMFRSIIFSLEAMGESKVFSK